MKRALLLLSIGSICHAMKITPSDEPLSPRSFHAAFYHIKERFEAIEDACKNQTDKSSPTIDTFVKELQSNSQPELVSVLWYKYYRYSTSDQCTINGTAITQDLAILNDARVRNLFRFDQDCLKKARVHIDNANTLNESIWRQIESISFVSPSHFSCTLTQEFLNLRAKLDFLFNKVFARNPDALELIESINNDIIYSPYAIFIPLLWDSRIVKSAERGHQNYQNNLTLAIKQKINELHAKISKMREHHP